MKSLASRMVVGRNTQTINEQAVLYILCAYSHGENRAVMGSPGMGVSIFDGGCWGGAQC